MKKIFAEFLNFAGHNTGFIVTQLVIVGVIIWTQGCNPTTQSLTSPGKQITRAELDVEVDTFIAMAEVRFADLAQKEEFKQTFLEHAMLWSATGAINPMGLVTALLAIGGIGATVDNVTKRRAAAKKTDAYVKKLEEINGK